MISVLELAIIMWDTSTDTWLCVMVVLDSKDRAWNKGGGQHIGGRYESGKKENILWKVRIIYVWFSLQSLIDSVK